MEYSAIIVTFNQKNALRRAINSILKQTIIPKEIIIIDNNSKDDTLELLLHYRKSFPFFRIFESKSNLGLCRAINIGVNLARNPIIFNMDHDAELEIGNWIEIASEKLKEKRIALIWGRSNGGNFPRFKYWNFIGSAILFKRDIYLKVGGFPEDFFIYDNELDLTVRYFIAGFYPYFHEKLDVKHGLPPEEKLDPEKKGKMYIYYDLSNRLFIYWKYYPFYFALILSLSHFIRVMTNYIKHLKYYFEPFKGLIRFVNKFYINVFREKRVLPLNQFLKICYQQQFPMPIYYLLKKIYE